MKKHCFLRFLTLISVLIVLTAIPITAYASEPTISAAGGESDFYLNQMGKEAMSAYRVLLHVICPFAILSVARCGFDILFASWLGNGSSEIDKAKKKMVLVFSATICLVSAPFVLGHVKNTVSVNAWKPPDGLEPIVGDWSGLEQFTGTGSLNISRTGEFVDEVYLGDGKSMGYCVYVPDNPKENMPLIIWLHGNDQQYYGNIELVKTIGMMKKVREEYGNNFPFIGLQPAGLNFGWGRSENDPKDCLITLIDKVVKEYKCDPNKIIITGHSMGSVEGVWHYVGEYGDYFSAAVPVSWWAASSQPDYVYRNWAKVPFRAYYGYDELKLNIDGGDGYSGMGTYMTVNINSIKEYGGTAEIFAMPNMRHYQTASEVYTKELIEWMISQ